MVFLLLICCKGIYSCQNYKINILLTASHIFTVIQYLQLNKKQFVNVVKFNRNN